MQIESLKTFCDLAETESFTKAAEINGVTQSAVSQTISSLEREFKSLLVERSKKSFRLTPEGQAVYDYSKRILQNYDAFESKLQELKGVISGQFRLSSIFSIGLYELPPYLKRFLKEHPSVNVRVEYRYAAQVYQDVLSNVVDIGLVAYPARDAKLEIVPLQTDSLVLICSPQHPFAKLKTVKLAALNAQKFVSFEKEIPTQKALEKVFKSHGVSVQSIMELNNVESVKRAVEIEAGIAIVPEATVRLEVAKRTLAAVRLEGEPCRELGAIYKKGRVLSPAIKKFLELLKHPL